MKCFHTNHGFSLVEVLVAMLMIATAVLGSAGLQSTSLRQGQHIQIDGQAVHLAQELRETILTYENASQPGLFASIDLSNPPAVNCYDAICTHTQMVHYLMWNWRNSLQQTLPVASFQLSHSTATENYLLHIVWDADGDGFSVTPSASSCVNIIAAGRGQHCLQIAPNG
jgi:type IV pilus assembly protein PilV